MPSGQGRSDEYCVLAGSFKMRTDLNKRREIPSLHQQERTLGYIAAVSNRLEPQIAKFEITEAILGPNKLKPCGVAKEAFDDSASLEVAQQRRTVERTGDPGSNLRGVRDFSTADVEPILDVDPVRRSFRNEATVGAVVANLNDRQAHTTDGIHQFADIAASRQIREKAPRWVAGPCSPQLPGMPLQHPRRRSLGERGVPLRSEHALGGVRESWATLTAA